MLRHKDVLPVINLNISWTCTSQVVTTNFPPPKICLIPAQKNDTNIPDKQNRKKFHKPVKWRHPRHSLAIYVVTTICIHPRRKWQSKRAFVIIKGEDQDSIQNTCNTKHNNPPARTVIPSHLKSLNTYPMNALMNWNSRLIGFWNWMTIHWVSGRLQCKWPQWHQKRFKPTWSRITELNIHTDGLQTSADQSRGRVGGVMESRIFCIPPPLEN